MDNDTTINNVINDAVTTVLTETTDIQITSNDIPGTITTLETSATTESDRATTISMMIENLDNMF